MTKLRKKILLLGGSAQQIVAIETAKRAGFPVVGVYDANGVEQARSKELSDIFLDDGSSFADLIPQIED